MRLFVMQYKVKSIDSLGERLWRFLPVSVTFITRQFKSTLPTLKRKMKILDGLCSYAVYEIICSGYFARYVGQFFLPLCYPYARKSTEGKSAIGDLNECDVKVSTRLAMQFNF